MGHQLDEGPADFSVQAGRVVSGLEGAACVLATRDGLALGSSPTGQEGAILARWAELGRGATAAARGFLTLDREAWVIATTRRFVGIAVVSSSVRPGFMLQRLEAILEDSEGIREEGPPRPFLAVRTATAGERNVAAEVLEVAEVLGHLGDRSVDARYPWSVADPAGTIGA